MLKYLLAFLLFFLICCPVIIQAQLIVEGISKPALCKNLGEVTLNVTGGNGSYSYRMISNTCNEALMPVQNSNVFKGLSTCIYTFEVSDTDGKSGSASVTVGGSYTSPRVSAIVDRCTIMVTTAGGQGPFKYELSKDSGHTWEVSAVPNWTKVARGNYLIRVSDACNVSSLLIVSVLPDPVTYSIGVSYTPGNNVKDSFYVYELHGIDGPYTTLLVQGNDTLLSVSGRFSIKDLKPKTCDHAKIIIRHDCGDDIQRLKLSLYTLDCFSFANGTVRLNPTYGVPPYSFLGLDESGANKTSGTGLFDNFLKNSSYLEIQGKDACGDLFLVQNKKSALRIRPEFSFKAKPDCAALNSARFEISRTTEEDNQDDPDRYTVECITCIPAASYNIKSEEEISINNLASGENIIKIKDNCGSVWTCRSSLTLSSFIGCDSASFHLRNSFTCDNRPEGEHTILGDSIANTVYTLKNDFGQIIASNAHGGFGRLSTGNYTIEASSNGCPTQQANFTIASSNVKIDLNVGLNRNKYSQYGGKCVTLYTLSVDTKYEPYILLNASGKNMGDGSHFQNGSLTWFDLSPGIYTIKSLLNCTVRAFELPELKAELKIIDSKNCPPGNSITLAGGKNWLEWNVQLHRDYDLKLFYYRNPGDWYDLKLISEFNADTASHTFFNLIPNKPYTFYLYSAFSDFGIASSCPLDSVTVVMPDYTPPQLKTNFSFFCDQDNTGLVQLGIDHGSAPFNLQQTDANFSESIGAPVAFSDTFINLRGLSNGNQYFKLTDACGKSATFQTTINNHDAITASKNCHGDIMLSYPYLPGARYAWKDGNVTLSDSSSIKINNPKNGKVYHLTFSYNNCVLDRVYTVDTSNLNSFSAAIQHTKTSNTICQGDSITLTAIFTGSQPTSILWNTGSISDRITVTQAGDYFVQAGNGANCIATASIHILESDKMKTELYKSDISCFGRNDGQIQSVTTGGSAPLTYDWSNGSKKPDIQNLTAGDYSLKVTDAAGCVIHSLAQVNEPAAIKLNPIIKNQSCSGAQDGSITLNVQGGTKPYSYQWSNATNNTAMITGLSSNILGVQVTDAQGCKVLDSFLITAPDKITSNRYDTICKGDSIRVNGNTYRDEGVYTTLVSSNSGCDSELIIHLKNYAASDFVLEKSDIKCFGEQNGSIRIAHLVGSGPFYYDVNDMRVHDTIINNLFPGMYAVRVIDSHGCKSLKSVSISDPEKVTVHLGQDTTIRFGDSVRIGIITNVNRDMISGINYSLNNVLHCAGCSEFNYIPNSNTRVLVRLETINGCIAEDERMIKLISEYKIFAPNVLSLVPMQDVRENHSFTVYGSRELTDIVYLRIFNRWGDQIFEANHIPPNEPGLGWDGTYKGVDVSPGVYLYLVKIEFKDGSTRSYQGDITIIR